MTLCLKTAQNTAHTAELRTNDKARYHGFTFLTIEEFYEILSLAMAGITGSSRIRLPIPADLRLALTLRYVATGESVLDSW